MVGATQDACTRVSPSDFPRTDPASCIQECMYSLRTSVHYSPRPSRVGFGVTGASLSCGRVRPSNLGLQPAPMAPCATDPATDRTDAAQASGRRPGETVGALALHALLS